eukprot:TRINITY_DN34147_c0_g1_i1.p1 TRINITY_DN34147_c0_g1~~TRINITY_DN34147_c0_g1_i1.p1  ORF type:complete len:790 (+),score=157.27 TRINITY_DN34147_c0_g1_i1:1-2370(+)
MFLLLLAMVAVVQACTPTTRSGYTCETSIPVGTIYYKVEGDVAKFALLTNTGGYAALGFNSASAMVGTSAVIGSTSLSPATYVISGKSESGVVQSTLSWLQSSSVTSENGGTLLEFSRSMTGLSTTSSTILVFAVHSSSGSLRYHSNKGVTSVTLSEQTPQPTPTPTQATPQPTQATPQPTQATPQPTQATPQPQATPPPTPPQTPPPTPQPTQATPTPTQTPSPTPEPTIEVVELPPPTPSLTCDLPTSPDHRCSYRPSDAVLISWTSPTASGLFTVIITLETTSGKGWIGVGFGDSMMGSTHTLVGSTVTGTATTTTYKIESRDPSTFEVLEPANNADVTVVGTVISLSFETTGVTNINWAGVPDVDDFSYHMSSRGLFVINPEAIPSVIDPTVPPGPAPESNGCNELIGTHVGCKKEVSYGVSLFWETKSEQEIEAGGLLTVALQLDTSITGWMGIFFAQSKGSMTPAIGTLCCDGGQTMSPSVYSLQSKSPSGVVPSSFGSSPDPASYTLVGGIRTLILSVRLDDDSVPVSGSTILINYAYHNADGNFPVTSHHSDRGQLVIDLQSGSVTVLNSSDEDKVKLHGLLMIILWGFIVPLAILLKRFATKKVPIGTKQYPIGFLLHALLLSAVGIATIAAVIKASTEFDSGVEKGHDVLGYVIATNACLQIIMGFLRPDNGAKGRNIFNFVHQILGRSTWILSIAQIFIGVDNFDRLYAHGDTTRTAAIIAAVFGGIAFMAVLVHRLVTTKPDQLSAGPGKGGNTTVPVTVGDASEQPVEEEMVPNNK